MANTVELFNSNGDPAGTFGTIQEAVDAASDGWTITASAGTYAEHVILNKAVTLQGVNAGVDGNDNTVRVAETSITGGMEVTAGGVTVDGVELFGGGLAINSANVTIENSGLISGGTLPSAFTAFNSSGLIFAHNYAQGWSFLLGIDTGSITGNTFSGNLNGYFVVAELSAFDIPGNSFSGTSGIFSDVNGNAAAASFDVGDFLHDNTYSETADQPIRIALTGPDGQVVNGTDTPTVFDVSFHVGAAEIHGGAGSDTIDYGNAQHPATIDLGAGTANSNGITTFTSIENALGSVRCDDSIIGDAGANVLDGRDSNDTIAGKGGNDTLIGGNGNDSLDGGDGDDSLDGGSGTDTASYADAGSGVTVSLAIATAQQTNGTGIDTLTSIENLSGSAFNDTLTGDAGANVLDGDGGNDTIAGKGGNDTLIGGTGSIENLTGSNFNDTLTGNAVANILSGGAGNDTLNGGAGDDSLIGGAGNDTLTGTAGNDILNGGAGNDHMDGGAAGTDTATYADATAGVTVNLALSTAQNTGGSGTDTLFNFENLTGSGFNDKLTGNAGANTLNGLAGNDTLNGAAGIDTLSGGAGNDRLIGGAGNDSLDGGDGTDSFVFDKGFGKDTIPGFVATGAAHDKIDFSTATFANFAAVKSHMVQSGANVIITLDSADTITLKGVTLASLTAADFTFHPGTAPAAPPQAVVAAWAAHGVEANTHFHLG